MANGTLKVSNIQTSSGSGTITIGQSGETITIPSGVTQTNIGGVMTPAFEANMSADQTVSDDTVTKVQFDTERFDTDSCYDNSTNYRFTPTIPGYYQFQMNQSISHGSIQASYIAIYKNGSSFCQTGRYFFSGDNYDDAVISTSCLMHCNGSDYVEFYAWRKDGSSSFGGSSALSQASGFLVRHAGYRRHGDGVA